MAITLTKDGRTKRTGKDYTDLRHVVFLRAKGRCENCQYWIWFESFHLHHTKRRGMGGSKRNDVPSEVKALCPKCHRLEHNQ